MQYRIMIEQKSHFYFFGGNRRQSQEKAASSSIIALLRLYCSRNLPEFPDKLLHDLFPAVKLLHHAEYPCHI